MELNLTLTAEPLCLAEHISRSEISGGIVQIKNIPERTYLAVTPKQWLLLRKFTQPITVPKVLEAVIDERTCPPLGEFYELILKAVRARILLQPGYTAPAIPAANWPLVIKPKLVRPALWVLFFAGLGLTIAMRPALPHSPADFSASLGATILAAMVGVALSASLLRGGGGEVYVSSRRLVRTTDSCMLPPLEKQSVLLAPLAMLAATTGFLALNRPSASIFPLVALLFVMRPFFLGRVGQMLRAQSSRRLSDAEHDFIFPPNRTPRKRWNLLLLGLRSSTTWLEITYGVFWTLLLGYFGGILTEVPPWTLVFWKTEGWRLLAAIAGSLLLLGLCYLGMETYVFVRERALARRDTLAEWRRRWLLRKRIATDESACSRAILRSPVLRQLPPPSQHELIKAMQPVPVGPWRVLGDFDEPTTQVSLILSGKVGVYRELRSGRHVLVQTLREDDLVGLNAAADPARPRFMYRTLTPVVLLQVEWTVAEENILARTPQTMLCNLVQKLPFLDRLPLCQNWHRQAVQRFAELSRVQDYNENEPILQEGLFSENFFIMFEGEARVSSHGNLLNTIRTGDFFGEIGLLQNSNTRAQVTASEGARCLCIPRREFLRFVVHNYTVALELERVSSARLGRPIFPLTPGNFQTA